MVHLFAISSFPFRRSISEKYLSFKFFEAHSSKCMTAPSPILGVTSRYYSTQKLCRSTGCVPPRTPIPRGRVNKGKKKGRSPDKDPGPFRGRLHRLQRGDKPLTDAPRSLRVRRARLHVEDLADIARYDIRAAPQLARYPPQALGRAPPIP